ncbi:MAG: hypothetical protein MJE66_14575 [Proteobacteria bacterium]|nr:hypothetical protein [Pseudomonadota bacterium]
MLDLSWGELLFCTALALVVVGPKDLPRFVRMLGAAFAKARRFSRELMDGIGRLEREVEAASGPRDGEPSWLQWVPSEVREERRRLEPHGDRAATAEAYQAYRTAVAAAKTRNEAGANATSNAHGPTEPAA